MTIIIDNDILTCEFPDTGLIPGYMIIFLKGDITSIDQLGSPKRLLLMDTIADGQSAIKTIINPARIYTLSIGEIQPRLHFHIFPRTDALLKDYQDKLSLSPEAPVSGMRLFEWAREAYATTPFGDDYDAINERIRQQLVQ